MRAHPAGPLHGTIQQPTGVGAPPAELGALDPQVWPRSATRVDGELHLAGRAVTRDGQNVRLTPLEYDLLVNLAQEPGQVLSRDTLLDRIWGFDSDADRRLVNVHIQRLRAKIEADPENPNLILTVRGVGYKANASQVRR